MESDENRTFVDHISTILSTHTAVKLRRKGRRLLWAVIRSIFLLGFSFIILYPVISMISKSFMHHSDIYDNTVLWMPRHFTLTNLRFAAELMDYGTAAANSFFLSVITTLLQLGSCMMVGYGFARFQFKLKPVLFAILILTIVIPPQQIIVPIFLSFRNFTFYGLFSLLGMEPLNLLNSYMPFFAMSATAMGMRNGLFIFIFRQAFRAMPHETEEAAMVDGANAFKTFYAIMLPGNVGVIVTIALFSFVWQWNDTFYSGIFLSKFRILPQAFQLFNSYISGRELVQGVSSYARQYNLEDINVLEMLRSSGMLLIMAPLIILYIFTQRYFVEGVERSGLVG